MKLTIVSDGSLAGTNLEFRMNGEEIPRMLAARARKKKLKHRGPPDVIYTECFVVDVQEPPGVTPIDSAPLGG
jgi:hypothetical protein